MKTMTRITLAMMLSTLVACGTTNTEQTSDPAVEGTTQPEDQNSSDSADETTNTNDSTDATDSSAPDTDPANTGDADTPSMAAELASQFEGTFALRRSVTTSQDIPMMGPSEIVTTSWGYAQVTFDGEDLWFTEHGCHVESGGDSPVEVDIPDAIARSIQPAAVKLKVWQEGETVYWQRPETVTLLGVTLDDPKGDALPDDPSDNRVFDQDGDGNPGVTVKLAGFISGDLYVVQRTINTYRGTLIDTGVLTGSIEEFGEQSIMGSTNSMLEQDIPSEALNNPDDNVIKMVAVDAAIDCDTVVDLADTLF